MIEEIYKISTGNEKAVERVIQDENIHYIHMVFNKNEGLPEHFSNSNVYMTVVRGKLSIGLNEQGINEYHNGTVLKIPVNTKMNVKNLSDEVLELIVVKAPAPEK
ncbi:MAG: cupin domain-containing protein [Lachnospiraceae bacterium]|nr:cupin domain-containing protein [Lachnospiraceae bacterium]